MARPTKYTKARAATICEAIEGGNTRRVAAALAGVGESTLFDWLARFQSFRDRVEKAEAEAESRRVARIVQAADDGTWQASAWWLERRHQDDWGKRDRLDVVATVRQLAREHGLTADEERDAVREAERVLREGAGGER